MAKAVSEKLGVAVEKVARDDEVSLQWQTLVKLDARSDSDVGIQWFQSSFDTTGYGQADLEAIKAKYLELFAQRPPPRG